MAYKYAEKNEGKRYENWLKERLLKKRLPFFLAQTPLNSQRKVPKNIKGNLTPKLNNKEVNKFFS